MHHRMLSRRSPAQTDICQAHISYTRTNLTLAHTYQPRIASMLHLMTLHKPRSKVQYLNQCKTKLTLALFRSERYQPHIAYNLSIQI